MFTSSICRLASIIWVGWAIWWLGVGLVTYSDLVVEAFGWLGRLREIRMTSILVVALSGYPSGFHGAGLVFGALDWLGVPILNEDVVTFFMQWLVVASLGYLQWFVVVPYLVRQMARYVGKIRKA
jgi:hypothetical protein